MAYPQKVTNLLTNNITLLDVFSFAGGPIVLLPGIQKDLFTVATDEDIVKSRHLTHLAAISAISVDTTFEAAASQAGDVSGVTISGTAAAGKVLTATSASAATWSTPDATQAELDLKAPIASPTFTGTVSGITKTMVGLGNVDNTADASKPVSTAQQTALDLKLTAASLQAYTSSAGAGGAATEAMVLTGLLATDTILAVTQKTPGGNNLPLLGYSTLANNALTGIWSADPGAGAVIVVSIKR